MEDITTTYTDQRRLAKYAELRMYEEGIPLIVNGDKTEYENQDSDPDKRGAQRLYSLANGGEIEWPSIGNSNPRYYPPEGDRERVEHIEVDARNTELFAPEQRDKLRDLIGEKVVFGTEGVGEHHNPEIGRYEPGSFKVQTIHEIENGKMYLDDTGPNEKTRVDPVPIIENLNWDEMFAVIPESLQDNFENGGFYRVTKGGVIDTLEAFKPVETEWVVDGDTWDAEDPWIETSHPDLMSFKPKAESTRKMPEGADKRLNEVMYSADEEFIGTELIVNDEVEPVEVVDQETREGRGTPYYAMILEDGREFLYSTTGGVSFMESEPCESLDLWYVGIVDSPVDVPAELEHGVSAAEKTKQSTL